MKSLKLIVFLAFLISPVLGQEKSFSSQEQELIDLIKKLNDAQSKDEVATVKSLTTEEVINIYGPSIVNLMLARQQSGGKPKEDAPGTAMLVRPISKELTDFAVSLSGEAAVVMAKETIVTRVQGIATTSRMQKTSFLIKKDGAWKVAASQVVPLNYRTFPRAEQVTFDVLPLPKSIRDSFWKKIADDKQGDENLKGGGDGKALFYVFDKPSDMLWFKFELYGEIDKERPAVSLSIDIDADQNTGYFWYGRDSNFKYDKVLNLGISEKLSEAKVRGFNGITSGKAAIDSNWLDEKKRNLVFHASPEEKTYYLGFKRADLGARTSKINILGSVGANSQWNDDIGDGFATIVLE